MSTIRFLAVLSFAACMMGGCVTEEDIDPGATAETYSLTEALRIGNETVVDVGQDVVTVWEISSSLSHGV